MSDTERAWPVAVDGVYPDDGAEIIRMDDFPGARAEIRVLQVAPDKWVSSIRFKGGGYEHHDEMGADFTSPTRLKEIWAATDYGWGQLDWLMQYHENNRPAAKAMMRWFQSQRDACEAQMIAELSDV